MWYPVLWSLVWSAFFTLVAFGLGYLSGRLHSGRFQFDGNLEKRALEVAKSLLLRRVLNALAEPTVVDANLQLEHEGGDQLEVAVSVIDLDVPAECSTIGF